MGIPEKTSDKNITVLEISAAGSRVFKYTKFTIRDVNGTISLIGRKSTLKYLLIWVMGVISVPVAAAGFGSIQSPNILSSEYQRQGMYILIILLASFWISAFILFYYKVLRKAVLPDIKFWNMEKQYMGKIRELPHKGNYQIYDDKGILLSSLKFNSFGQKRFLSMDTADNRRFTSDYKYLNRPERIYHEIAYRGLHSELRIVDSAERLAFYVKTGVTTKQSEKYRIQNDLVKIYDPRSVFNSALAAFCCLFHLERQDFRNFIISPEDSEAIKVKSTRERYLALSFPVQILFLPLILINIPIYFFFEISKLIHKSIIRGIYYGVKSQTWPTIQGEVVATTFSNGTGASAFNVYYEYDIHLQRYHSQRRVFGYQDAKKSDPLPLTEKYAVEKPVQVYYHPNNPRIAVLEPGLVSPGILTLIFDSLIYGAPGIAILMSLLLLQIGIWVNLINMLLLLNNSPPIEPEFGFSFSINAAIDPSWLFILVVVVVLFIIFRRLRGKANGSKQG
ncbi:MAG: DUF3592 domain-containing protein [Candidatus Heimdallarchaeota archaeon]